MFTFAVFSIEVFFDRKNETFQRTQRRMGHADRCIIGERDAAIWPDTCAISWAMRESVFIRTCAAPRFAVVLASGTS